MPDVRYVCISDMHLGGKTSLLTNLRTASDVLDPSEASPVLKRLVECLRDLIGRNIQPDPKPTLILNGDILEFALAHDNDAAMCFERFMDLIAPVDGAPLFGRIVFNPGNHDHHLWETARETQYVDFLKSGRPETEWGSTLIPRPWHTTKIYPPAGQPLRSFFLTSLIQRRQDLLASGRIIETAYPNFGLRSPDGATAVLFHHGHFVEDMYLLTSTLRTLLFPNYPFPEFIYDWEGENFAWIDFFWSALGRCGLVGSGVECVYEKLQDEKQVGLLLENLAKGLARYVKIPVLGDIPGLGDRAEAQVFELILDKVADAVFALERKQPDAELSRKAESGLRRYVDGPLKKQIVLETGAEPSRVTFVFGHTHKPFEREMNFAGYPGWVHVYNSGGWVVDTVERNSRHGGAVILLDEDLNPASLRMYNEAESIGGYAVRVAESHHPGDEPGPFCREIENRIAANPRPWRDFSAASARAVSVRAENLRARIESQELRAVPS